MNTRAFTLALIISFVAMFMVYTYIDDKETSLKNRYGIEKPVVVAKEDINELDLIDDSKITVITMPQKFVHNSAFTDIKELENTIATVPIKKGEILTKPRVTFPGVQTGLSRQVSLGKRAIAINITERQAVGKLIKPGDRVDILAAVDYSSRKDKQEIVTVLQDVLVLSTGRSMTNSIPIIGVKTPKVIKQMKLNTYDEYNTITLELSPAESQKLIYLMTYSGQLIYFSLRNNSDKTRERLPSTKLYDILSDGAAIEAKNYFRERYEN